MVEMGQIQKNTMETRLSASASEGWWREEQEQPIVGWSRDEKKVDGCCAQVIVDIDAVERLPRPENLEVTEARLEARNWKRQQYFPALRHIRKAEPLRGKQKTMVGKSEKRRCTARERAKRVA